ncbi:hypothetical protein As57867_006019, partial [Aphanomyces stellatus]
MLFATMLFYAVPCYSSSSLCPITDIFNAGYFVMVTVSTVGYGDQVVSTDDGVAILITTGAMIFGSLYLAMPLAIIGMTYETTWTRFVNHTRTSKSTLDLAANVKSTSIETLHPNAHVVNLQYFCLTSEVLQLHRTVQEYMTFSPDSIFSGETSAAHNRALEKVFHASKQVVVRYDVIAQNMKIFRPHGKRLPPRPTKIKRKLSLKGMAVHLFSIIKHAINGDVVNADIAELGPHFDHERALRKHVRHMLHVSHSWLNRIIFLTVVLSLAVFYAETMPEFQAFGPQSRLCLSAMARYCESATVETDPGCFSYVSPNMIASPPTKVQMDCVIEPTPTDESNHTTITKPSVCYGVGWNFGSNASRVPCASSFAASDKVCNLRQCQPGHIPVIDMTKHWLYFEVLCGVVFTIEFGLRLYAAKHRRTFLRTPSTWIEVAALVPFYIEGILAGLQTDHSAVFAIVPTFPTMLTLLPMLKSLRILKIGKHFKSSAVLARTARLTYTRLMIPLSLLFFTCVLTSALFYEIERGVDCVAHLPCRWLRWDVMTRDIAAPYPPGKRIQIQADKLTLLTNMWRSTWLSVETLTTVGYGHMKPRTPLGRLVDILTMVFGWCYTAIPLSLVGGQFYTCY